MLLFIQKTQNTLKNCYIESKLKKGDMIDKDWGSSKPTMNQTRFKYKEKLEKQKILLVPHSFFSTTPTI